MSHSSLSNPSCLQHPPPDSCILCTCCQSVTPATFVYTFRYCPVSVSMVFHYSFFTEMYLCCAPLCYTLSTIMWALLSKSVQPDKIHQAAVLVQLLQLKFKAYSPGTVFFNQAMYLSQELCFEKNVFWSL